MSAFYKGYTLLDFPSSESAMLFLFGHFWIVSYPTDPGHFTLELVDMTQSFLTRTDLF